MLVVTVSTNEWATSPLMPTARDLPSLKVEEDNKDIFKQTNKKKGVCERGIIRWSSCSKKQ